MFCWISPGQHKEVMAVLLSCRIFIPSCLLYLKFLQTQNSYFVGEKPCSSFIIFLQLDNSFQLCSPAKLSSFRPMACSAMLNEKRVLILCFLFCGTFLLAPSNGQCLPSPKHIYWKSTALSKHIFFMNCRAKEQENIFMWEITTCVEQQSHFTKEEKSGGFFVFFLNTYLAIHFDQVMFCSQSVNSTYLKWG